MQNEWTERRAMREQIESLQETVRRLEMQVAFQNVQQQHFTIERMPAAPSIAVTPDEDFDQQKAMATISDLMAKLQSQRDESEEMLERGYEEAYQMIVEERKQRDMLFLECEDKFKKYKDHVITMIDEFMALKWDELTTAGEEGAVRLLDQWRAAMPPAKLFAVATGEDESPNTETLKKLAAQVTRLSAELAVSDRALKDANKEVLELRKAMGLPDKPIMKPVMDKLLKKLEKS